MARWFREFGASKISRLWWTVQGGRLTRVEPAIPQVAWQSISTPQECWRISICSLEGGKNGSRKSRNIWISSEFVTHLELRSEGATADPGNRLLRHNVDRHHSVNHRSGWRSSG